MSFSNEELISMIDRGIDAAWFGDISEGPWPNDADGGELRIANALINVLIECEKSDRLGQPVISTNFIRKTVEDVLVLDERRMTIED